MASPTKTSPLRCSKCTLPRSINNYNHETIIIEELLRNSNHELLVFLSAFAPDLSISYNYFTQKIEISVAQLYSSNNPEKISPEILKNVKNFTKSLKTRNSHTGNTINEIYKSPDFIIEYTEIDQSKFPTIVEDPNLNKEINLAMEFEDSEIPIDQDDDYYEIIHSEADIDRITTEMNIAMKKAYRTRRGEQTD